MRAARLAVLLPALPLTLWITMPSLLACWNLPHMLILVMGFIRDSLQYNIRQTLFKDGQSELVQSILYQKELTEIIICPVKHYRLLTSKSNSENFWFNRPQNLFNLWALFYILWQRTWLLTWTNDMILLNSRSIIM